VIAFLSVSVICKEANQEAIDVEFEASQSREQAWAISAETSRRCCGYYFCPTLFSVTSGRAKAQGCTRCHGRNGIQALAEKTGWTDSISSFVTRRLTDLREGVSHHAVMTDIAAVLSDEDIRDISAWIQSLSDKSK